MKYKFQLEKKNFEIEIPNTATFHSPASLAVNKKKLEICIGEQHGDEIRSLYINNRLYQIEVVRDEAGYPRGIFVNDDFYSGHLLKIDDLFYYQEKPRKAARSGFVKSFIPGYIKKVYFKTGETVHENEIVLIHEAMKMENEIRAPRSGTIKTIGVEEGQSILANHLLFEIE